MNDFYGNIGGKLKGLAFGTFIVETVAAVITAFGLIASDLFLAGCLTLILGPLAAWASSWLLYAFGELVEKTVKNERNSAEMVALLRQMQPKKEEKSAVSRVMTAAPVSHVPLVEKENTVTDNNTWICGTCGRQNHLSRKSCWGCNRPFEG